jgi:hypothetical protein
MVTFPQQIWRSHPGGQLHYDASPFTARSDRAGLDAEAANTS